MFDEVIRQVGAKTVFYSTWARRGAPKQNQQALDYAYMQIACELKAIVVPVGSAWQSVQKMDWGVELYSQDGSHPSAAGTYLAACVFYATLTGKSPEGLSHVLSGHAVDDAGRVGADTPRESLCVKGSSDSESGVAGAPATYGRRRLP
jgi:hypothetical protein